MNSSTGMDRPRPDPYLATLGEPYEDISAIASAQLFTSAGPTMHSGAVETLAEAGHGGPSRIGGALRRITRTSTRDVRLAELVAADLMTPSGELTDSGRGIAEALARPTGHLRVESARGRTPLALDAYERDGHTVIVATASPAALGEEPRGEQILETATTITLDWIDVSYLPVTIASWVGLAPAWSLATEPELLPRGAHPATRGRPGDATTAGRRPEPPPCLGTGVAPVDDARRGPRHRTGSGQRRPRGPFHAASGPRSASGGARAVPADAVGVGMARPRCLCAASGDWASHRSRCAVDLAGRRGPTPKCSAGAWRAGLEPGGLRVLGRGRPFTLVGVP